MGNQSSLRARRARITTAIATAALLLVTGAMSGTAATAATAAPVQAETTVRLAPTSRTIDANWSGAYVWGTTTTLRVTLPVEAAELGVTFLDWTLNDFDLAQSGRVSTADKTFDIALPSDSTQPKSFQLQLNGNDETNSNKLRLTVFIEPSVPMQGDPLSPIASIDVALEKRQSGGVSFRYGGDPASAIIVPGHTVLLSAEPRFWTDGPEGLWAGSRGVSMIGTLFDKQTGSEIPLGTEVTADGSGLVLSIPEQIGDFRTGWISLSATPIGGYGRAGQVDVFLPVYGDTSITTDRIGGADRYAVSVGVSQAAHPAGASVAYVVSGTGFADALSAGPVAAAQQGPVLLTPPDALPSAVAQELRRLAPERIVVVGGPASVSEAVVTGLGLIAPTERVSGADRYEVSRNLAALAHPDGAPLVYVATGTTFPDALSAGAAAGAASMPVVLVPGGGSALDAASTAALGALSPQEIRIVGGPASVTEGVADSLEAIAPVTRYGGADRYAASVSLNSAAFGVSDRAFLTTGSTFPDALTGSAFAGQSLAPLYVSRPDCVPVATISAMRDQGVRQVTLIGGPASLTQAVADLTPCAA
ncbi:cell wall-binding repeat-containing protein [Herbiconiux sp. P15]|uniref:cell wall-binding repeat-containing protein n=1 Tax=Herbiconiux liukaitaii TaxID=3342799 RepID=UPI0035BA60FB